jgi:nickel-dependent lactate racemase
MQVKYGRNEINLQLQDYDLLTKSFNFNPLTMEEIIENLNEYPVMMEGIEEIISSSNNSLIVLPDATRKSGAEQFLPYIVNIFDRYNKPFHIIFAPGTHRNPSEEEKKWIVTEDIYNQYRNKLIDHDCDNIDEHFYFGKTRNNTPILINNAYTKADTIITIGSVSYHYFAGFGGGRKLIIPGIAARKTAISNHKLVLDEELKARNPFATTANLKNNPVHNDLVEAVMIARRGKTLFSINTILDDENKIIGITCGDLFISHLKACELLIEKTTIKVTKKYTNLIVSAGGYPKDINMIQAQKSLDRVHHIAEEGKNIFFFAECQDGYGNKHFQDFFDIRDSKTMLETLFTEYQINRHTAYNLKKITEKYRCYLYSNFSKEDTERMGFIKLNSPEEISQLLIDGPTAYIPSSYNFYFKSV